MQAQNSQITAVETTSKQIPEAERQRRLRSLRNRINGIVERLHQEQAQQEEGGAK